jgi:hypothetical protein
LFCFTMFSKGIASFTFIYRLLFIYFIQFINAGKEDELIRSVDWSDVILIFGYFPIDDELFMAIYFL